MILYAIVETNTDMYVTRENSLEELGKHTRLFDSEDEAKRALKYMGDYGMEFNTIRNALVWGALEQKYHIDRWHLPVSYKEFKSMESEFDLEIVKVQLNERKQTNKKKSK